MKRNAWLAFLTTVLLTFATIGITVVAVWADLDPELQAALAGPLYRHAGILIVGGIILVVVIGFIVNLMYHWYVVPFQAIADDTRIICVSNPSHRLAVHGRSEIVDLAASINGIASRYQALQEDVAARIQDANAALEEERNTLAALMSNLTQGVLVCNLEGRILLYNQRARILLEGPAQRLSGEWIGLGRSVYGVLDAERVTHALHNIDHRLQQGETGLMASFAMARAGGQLLNVHLVPVLDNDNAVLGHILTLEDITRRVGTENRLGLLLKSLSEGYRSAVTGIRAAVETVLAFPEMDEAGRQKFLEAIRDEALKMNDQLHTLETEYAQDLKYQWTLRETLGSDLLATVERQVIDTRGVGIEVSAPVEPLWLNVDSYTLSRAILFLIGRLTDTCRAHDFSLRLERGRDLASLTLAWSGAELHTEALKSWGMLNVPMDSAGNAVTLFEVIERHGGAIWTHADNPSGRPALRLMVPAVEEGALEAGWGEAGTGVAGSGGGAAGDHDFDFTLFHSKAVSGELDVLPLEQLGYTVFDTETTGLNPSGGDEIIAIGAVRVFNGRVLRREIFDCLVDPRRPISEEAAAIHGISSKMLRGMPTIDEVLPRFKRFVEDTVIIGHNVAFDMRFLELKQEQTGIRFDNPVLDTLLLASALQPKRVDQRLDALAERLGVPIAGRHTALGDALTTAEVFLALIPMLKARSIRTLSEAKQACETTKYAKIKY